MSATERLLTDQALLASIAEGDSAAFATFYDRHSARVFGLLMCILRDSIEAEEAFQDVFWQVWTRAGQYEAARAAPIAWLTVITRSRALDRRRRLARLSRKVTEELPDSLSYADASATMEQREAADRARELLEKLPHEQKILIRLSFFDGMTHREIAERENLPLGTVKTRIRLGIMRLRDQLLTG